MNPNERVLVTGGTGFLGATLVRRLCAAGKSVFLVTRSSSPAARLADLWNSVVALPADLRDPDSVATAVSVARPEVVYHLGAVGLVQGREDPSTVFETNVQGTLNLVRAVARQGCRAFIHVGSGAEYGPRKDAILEDDGLRPQGEYGVAKAAASMLVRAFAQTAGLPVTVVRIFAAYGPGESEQRLVPYVMRCCQRGEAPQLSEGTQRRDFIHVEDVARLLECAAQVPNAMGRVLHAATGVAYSVREMVQIICDQCADRRLCPQFSARPRRLDEPDLYLGSRELTTTLTGWTPHYSLREGVAQTWQVFRGQESTRAVA